MNKTLLRFLITALIGLTIGGAVFAYQAQHYSISKDLCMLISNASYVSGILLLLTGLLCFIGNKGGSLIVGYLAYRVKACFIRKKETVQGFFEYVILHHDKKKIPLSNLFIVGGVLMTVAIITAIIVGK